IKNNAKEDVESKAQAAIDNIEARDDLSEDEKEKLVKEINDAKDTAITGIDKASSETGVNEAVSRAEDQFDLAKDKAGAIESIKAEAKETKESIEGTANLEEDEINQRTSEVDTHAENAIKEVLNATTKNAIENAVDAVSLEMHKTDAKAGIDAHRNKGLADLENLDNLTEEEKEDLSDRIEQVRKGVLEKVDEATSKNAASDEVHAGVGEIQSILDEARLLDAKNKATKEITNAEQAAKAAIDDLSHLSDDEKAAAKENVANAADAARTEIAEADTINQVNAEKDTGLDAIDAAQKDAEFLNDKNGAKVELKEEKDRIAGLIDQIKGVDQADKNEALADLETALSDALKAVEAAGNDEELAKAVKDGKDAMQDIIQALTELGNDNIDDARSNAKTEINSEADEAKKAIDNLPNL